MVISAPARKRPTPNKINPVLLFEPVNGSDPGDVDVPPPLVGGMVVEPNPVTGPALVDGASVVVVVDVVVLVGGSVVVVVEVVVGGSVVVVVEVVVGGSVVVVVLVVVVDVVVVVLVVVVVVVVSGAQTESGIGLPQMRSQCATVNANLPFPSVAPLRSTDALVIWAPTKV